MSLLSHYSNDYKERLARICKTGIIFFKQKIIYFFLGDFGDVWSGHVLNRFVRFIRHATLTENSKLIFQFSHTKIIPSHGEIKNYICIRENHNPSQIMQQLERKHTNWLLAVPTNKNLWNTPECTVTSL